MSPLLLKPNSDRKRKRVEFRTKLAIKNREVFYKNFTIKLRNSGVRLKHPSTQLGGFGLLTREGGYLRLFGTFGLLQGDFDKLRK